jgi:hypothetical protein
LEEDLQAVINMTYIGDLVGTIGVFVCDLVGPGPFVTIDGDLVGGFRFAGFLLLIRFVRFLVTIVFIFLAMLLFRICRRNSFRSVSSIAGSGFSTAKFVKGPARLASVGADTKRILFFCE